MMTLMRQGLWVFIIGTHLIVAVLHLRNYAWPPKPYSRRISSALLAGMALSVAGLVARLVGWIPHVASLPFMALAALCGFGMCLVLKSTGGRR